MNEEKVRRYSYLSETALGLNTYQVALTLVKYSGDSTEQAGEVAKELCYHRNFSSLPSIFLEEFFMQLWLIERYGKSLPDDLKKDLKDPCRDLSGEVKDRVCKGMELLEKRLEGIPMPFKFKPGVFV